MASAPKMSPCNKKAKSVSPTKRKQPSSNSIDVNSLVSALTKQLKNVNIEKPCNLMSLDPKEVSTFIKAFKVYQKDGGSLPLSHFIDQNLKYPLFELEMGFLFQPSEQELLAFLLKKARPSSPSSKWNFLEASVKVNFDIKDGLSRISNLFGSYKSALNDCGIHQLEYKVAEKLILSKLPPKFKTFHEQYCSIGLPTKSLKELYDTLAKINMDKKGDGLWDYDEERHSYSAAKKTYGKTAHDLEMEQMQKEHREQLDGPRRSNRRS